MSELTQIPQPIWLCLFFILGALLGSFANVVICRLPLNESIVRPRSRCRKCKSAVAWYDNVPIFSFLVLRGRCRNCYEKIGWRYPLVELIMALGFAAFFYWHGFHFFLIEHLIFFFSLVIVSFIDLDHMILPDSFTLSGIVIGLIGAYLNPSRVFSEALFGALMGGGFLWLVAYVYFLVRKQEGMGGGDIKLLAWIGAVLGWQSIPFVILVSCLFGSLVGVFLALREKKGFQTVIPFGPYLALGAVAYIFNGYLLGKLYLQTFMPDVAP